MTIHTQATAAAADLPAFNRGHWTIENRCRYPLDWNWDEDRCTIRTGHGPANITALRRFAIGTIKAIAGVEGVDLEVLDHDAQLLNRLRLPLILLRRHLDQHHQPLD